MIHTSYRMTSLGQAAGKLDYTSYLYLKWGIPNTIKTSLINKLLHFTKKKRQKILNQQNIKSEGEQHFYMKRPPTTMATPPKHICESVLQRWIILLFVNTFTFCPQLQRNNSQLQLTLRGWCSSSGTWRVWEGEHLGSPPAWTYLGAAWCSGSLWPGWGGGSGSGGTLAGTVAGLCPLPEEDKACTHVSTHTYS